MCTVARYALDGPVLPLVRDTLPVAEAVRRALMSRSRKVKEGQRSGRAPLPGGEPAVSDDAFAERKATMGPANLPDAERFASAVFSGKDQLGEPLKDDHAHAFYLPSDEDGDGRIDHVTVYAHHGFDRDEVRAIDSLRRLMCSELELELSLLLVGLGDRESFRGSPLCASSTTWVSATPFLVTRHMKRRGRKRDPQEFFEGLEGRAEFVKQVLREELERRGLLREGVEIGALERTPAIPPLYPIEFRLRRARKPGDDAANRPRGLYRIRFPQPLAGPIALGHSCHFGLGLFLTEGGMHERSV
jgi:CRISPR-associated protein Csb2